MSQDVAAPGQPWPTVEQVWDALRTVYPDADATPHPAAAREQADQTIMWAVHLHLLHVLPEFDHATWDEVIADLENLGAAIMEALGAVPLAPPTPQQVTAAFADVTNDQRRPFAGSVLLALHAIACEWQVANMLGIQAAQDGTVYGVNFERFVPVVVERWQEIAVRTLLGDFDRFDELFEIRTGRAPAYRAVDPATRFAQLKQDVIAREEARVADEQARAQHRSEMLRAGGQVAASVALGAVASIPARRQARRQQTAATNEARQRARSQARWDELRDLNLTQALRRERNYRSNHPWG